MPLQPSLNKYAIVYAYILKVISGNASTFPDVYKIITRDDYNKFNAALLSKTFLFSLSDLSKDTKYCFELRC